MEPCLTFQLFHDHMCPVLLLFSTETSAVLGVEKMPTEPLSEYLLVDKQHNKCLVPACGSPPVSSCGRDDRGPFHDEPRWQNSMDLESRSWMCNLINLGTPSLPLTLRRPLHKQFRSVSLDTHQARQKQPERSPVGSWLSRVARLNSRRHRPGEVGVRRVAWREVHGLLFCLNMWVLFLQICLWYICVYAGWGDKVYSCLSGK